MFDCAVGVHAIFCSICWPKAKFTVAWGIAPGTMADPVRLAEGLIHILQDGG